MYKAKLPKTNDNISHISPLKDFFTLLIGLVISLVVFLWILGVLVDFSVRFISPETEIKMFAKFGNLEFKKNEDTQTTAKFQPMLNKLSKCAEISHPLKLHFIKANTPNAFAYPGGHIVVNSGILKSIKSQNALAFVLSHELGHFKNKDHLRSLGRNLIILGLVSFMNISDSEVFSTLSPVSDFMDATYSQNQESQADKEGLMILNCYYHHVGGATEFFEYLQNHDKKFILQNHYFSTHPETKKRIQNIKTLIKKNGFKVNSTIPL